MYNNLVELSAVTTDSICPFLRLNITRAKHVGHILFLWMMAQAPLSPNVHIWLELVEVLAGGNAVILFASKYKDVHTVINISGRFDLRRGMEGRLGKDFLQRIKQDGFIDVKNKRGKLLESN